MKFEKWKNQKIKNIFMISLFKTHPEYIYIVHEREFINSKKNIYKIGRTSKSQGERMKGYPKDSVMLFSYSVCDSYKIENTIKEQLKKYVINRTDIGSEYFEGELHVIVDHVVNIITKNERELLIALGKISEDSDKSLLKPEDVEQNTKKRSFDKIDSVINIEIKKTEDIDYKFSKLKTESYIYCHRCENQFNDIISLRKHWKSIIPCDFVCLKCGYRLNSRKSYQRHVRSNCRMLHMHNLESKILKKNIRL